MNSAIPAALVFLLITLTAAEQSPVSFSNSLLTAKVVPSNGVLEISEVGNSNVFDLSIVQIQEISSNDQNVVNSFNSFNNQVYTLSQANPNQLQGINSTSVSLMTNVVVNGSSVSLIITFFLFDADGNIFFNNGTRTVTADQMMIYYMLQGWPVVQSTNILSIEIGINTPGGGGSYKAPVLSLSNEAAVTFSSTASTSTGLSPVDVTVKGESNAFDVVLQLAASIELQYYILWSGSQAAPSVVSETHSSASTLSSFLFNALF